MKKPSDEEGFFVFISTKFKNYLVGRLVGVGIFIPVAGSYWRHWFCSADGVGVGVGVGAGVAVTVAAAALGWTACSAATAAGADGCCASTAD